MSKLQWVDDGTCDANVREREFRVAVNGREVPGLLWQPV